MIWLIFAFLTAFFESLKDVFSKKSLKNIDEYVASLALRFLVFILLMPFLFFMKMPSLNDKFFMALFVSGSFNVITTILYMKALKYSDLSITAPMLTFTPLFLLITSPFIVGEFPNSFGLIGVLLIVFGSYTLNIKQMHEGYLVPFKALLNEKGPKLMFLVAFIWSITANFDKIGVQNSSPIFWVISINLFMSIMIFPIILYKSRGKFEQVSKRYKSLLSIGLFSALSLVFQMTAINLALVAHVVSIKRTSAIMSVILGYLIFKEKGIKERLFGVFIMVIGVLFIALS